MDISRNKSSLDGLEKQKEESIQSERLAFTGRIAASIAHEIRNPLGNLSLSAQLLKDAFTADSPWAKHIEVIMRNTERINFLITELLNCARPPKLNIEPHDIHEILESILDLIKTKIGSRPIEVNKSFDPDVPLINVDKEQIDRAFSNVMINAVESMPDRGRMTISTAVEEGFVVVRVQDTGEGIPEDDIIRIFDPFFSTKPSGIGLGLSMTYGIIASHDGTITVESKRQNGTVFAISLPIR
jgi:signal transduction histidine kinase